MPSSVSSNVGQLAQDWTKVVCAAVRNAAHSPANLGHLADAMERLSGVILGQNVPGTPIAQDRSSNCGLLLPSPTDHTTPQPSGPCEPSPSLQAQMTSTGLEWSSYATEAAGSNADSQTVSGTGSNTLGNVNSTVSSHVANITNASGIADMRAVNAMASAIASNMAGHNLSIHPQAAHTTPMQQPPPTQEVLDAAEILWAGQHKAKINPGQAFNSQSSFLTPPALPPQMQTPTQNLPPIGSANQGPSSTIRRGSYGASTSLQNHNFPLHCYPSGSSLSAFLGPPMPDLSPPAIPFTPSSQSHSSNWSNLMTPTTGAAPAATRSTSTSHSAAGSVAFTPSISDYFAHHPDMAAISSLDDDDSSLFALSTLASPNQAASSFSSGTLASSTSKKRPRATLVDRSVKKRRGQPLQDVSNMPASKKDQKPRSGLKRSKAPCWKPDEDCTFFVQLLKEKHAQDIPVSIALVHRYLKSGTKTFSDQASSKDLQAYLDRDRSNIRTRNGAMSSSHRIVMEASRYVHIGCRHQLVNFKQGEPAVRPVIYLPDEERPFYEVEQENLDWNIHEDFFYGSDI